MRALRTAAVAVTIAGAAASGSLGATGGASPGGPPIGAARLQGSFLLEGTITYAQRVYGERRGLVFFRTWSFAPTCAAGACSTIRLTRQRVGGNDRLILRRAAPDLFKGTGSFYAPLRCGSRTYARGSSVPFSITVRIIGTATVARTVYASRVRASYENRNRANNTPCVAFLGHDAATFHGHLTKL